MRGFSELLLLSNYLLMAIYFEKHEKIWFWEELKMSKRTIEDIISDVLKGEAKKNASDLVAYLRADGESGEFSIAMHDEKDESGWNVSNLGFIIITGSDDFPGPWTMWIGADNIGQHAEIPADEHIKEFDWEHVSPCGSCGGDCSPGVRTKIFGKDFENTCQSNLIFVNPDAATVESVKKIIDIRKNDILKKN